MIHLEAGKPDTKAIESAEKWRRVCKRLNVPYEDLGEDLVSVDLVALFDAMIDLIDRLPHDVDSAQSGGKDEGE